MNFFDVSLVLGFNFIKKIYENFLFKLFLAYIFWVFAPIRWKLTIVWGGDEICHTNVTST